MSIKCTNAQLSRAGKGILKLRAVDVKSGASHVERAMISRFLQGVLRELAEYERVQQELLDECATPVEGRCPKCGIPIEGLPSGLYNILPAKKKEYREEMRKLDAIEVEIPGRPLPVTLHKYADLTPDDMLGLGDLIEWPPEAGNPEPSPK